MADSENSRTLPSRTHRNLLSSVEEFLSRKSLPNRPDRDTDPAVQKWEIWQHAYAEFCQLCRLQQFLERKMLAEVGEPYIQIDAPGHGLVSVSSETHIEMFLAGPEQAVACAEAKDRLKEHFSLRNAADILSGYSRALRAESEASDREQATARELWNTPSLSVLGAMAKLHVLITLGVLAPDCDEFPWPPLRSVLDDLMRVAEETNADSPNDL